jgi:hypothetical protein
VVQLARLWKRRGRSAEASALLQKAVAGFPDGQTTTDMDMAKGILKDTGNE